MSIFCMLFVRTSRHTFRHHYVIKSTLESNWKANDSMYSVLVLVRGRLDDPLGPVIIHKSKFEYLQDSQ